MQYRFISAVGLAAILVGGASAQVAFEVPVELTAGGKRFDSLLYPGYTITPFYDSLLGKLIVWDQDRPSALRRLARALGELEISGLKTTLPLHRALVAEAAVQSASFHTTFLENWLASGPPGLVHHEELAST